MKFSSKKESFQTVHEHFTDTPILEIQNNILQNYQYHWDCNSFQTLCTIEERHIFNQKCLYNQFSRFLKCHHEV